VWRSLNPRASADGDPAADGNFPKQLVAATRASKGPRCAFEGVDLSLNRSEKEAVINEVTSLAAKAQTLVIAEYRGITVADMTKLRADARSKGVSLSVLKNTLARRAVAGSRLTWWLTR
jgi:hypothetical protein